MKTTAIATCLSTPGTSAILREATRAIATGVVRAESPCKAIGLACETLGASDELLEVALLAFNEIAVTTSRPCETWWGYAWMQLVLECTAARGEVGIAMADVLLASRRLDTLQRPARS